MKKVIASVLKNQRAFFKTKKTFNSKFRITMLKKLLKSIKKYERDIIKSLYTDLHKPEYEAYAYEINLVYHEIYYHINHVKRWIKPKRVKASFVSLPSRNYCLYEPLGLVLIFSTWSNPFLLLMMPLIAAISAGNCVVCKPSELSANTGGIIEKILSNAFDEDYVSVFLGGKDINQILLKEKYDYIFFTGSYSLGKIVMTSAAKNITPLTLGLGGKNPCIVDNTVRIEVAARRIIVGKMINAGQSCTAPDYVFVHETVYKEFLEQCRTTIKCYFTENIQNSPDYGRIISNEQFDRIFTLIGDNEIFSGGDCDKSNKYISPTIIINVSPKSDIMKEEIFGPVLPVIKYSSIDDVFSYISSNPKPLSLYLFTKDRRLIKRVNTAISFGNACINDTVMQNTNMHLPFGGVGASGFGKYHGKAGFDLFSNLKSVCKRSLHIELELRYPPYKKKLSFVRLMGK